MYITVEEAAKYCRVSVESIERYLRDPNHPFPHCYQPGGPGARRVLKQSEVDAYLESRPVPKPELYLIDPIARVVMDIPCRIDDMSMLRSILHAGHADALEVVPIKEVSERRWLVAVGFAAAPADAPAYYVGGEAMRGRCVLAKRLKDAGDLPRGAGSPDLEPVVLDDDELIQWSAPPPVEKKSKKA